MSQHHPLQLLDFDYHLPAHLIARYPLPERSGARLLHVQSDGTSIDRYFSDLIDLLHSGDVLVLNDTKVMKARLRGKKTTGGQVELLVERLISDRCAHCHIKASNAPKSGTTVHLVSVSDESDFMSDISPSATVIGREERLFIVEFSKPVLDILDEYGQLPIPPYFERAADELDETRYQTVFHDPSKMASVAAPTASLHFDESTLARLRAKGIILAFVTLHVGAGTFIPVRVQDIRQHHMHTEWGEVPLATVQAIKQARAIGRRIIAVGTTATRALESAAAQNGTLQAWSGETQIFIYPGFQFKVIDALLTNFHLPQSTLLMLVAALSKTPWILAAYQHAIDAQYRFYSYGDAMLVERAIDHDAIE